MLRLIWILVFGLALLCAPAQAASCRDDCKKREIRDDWSILLKAKQPGDRSYGASHRLVDGLPPGLAEEDELPPGLRDDWRVRDDWRAYEWRKRIATLPAVPRQDPRSASLPIPEPTELVLFGGGLLLARAAVRRRRS